MSYDFSEIEKKWQAKWLTDKTYEPDLDKAKKPFYNLMMFPYPSAEGLHVGNMYAFTGSDIYGRFKRMQGYDVFEPIGLDGFGIHSENYAIRAGKHPAEAIKAAQENFYRQLQEIGNGFAWDEKLETYDPSYYKWTQWIFVQMFKHGLAYRKKQPVNWCPSCKTVLADEQVVREECERCLTKVEKRELEQWFFKITEYAERLLRGIEKLDWSERVKIAQRNWIGKSEGAFIKFPLRGVPGQPDGKHFVEVFTTRPDTIFGATFVAISPELAKQWITIGWQTGSEVKKYIEKTLAERAKTKDAAGVAKTGVDAGIKAVNPANKEEIPVWVVNYVLGDVGTGAIMAVPAHDERDFEFAKKCGLPIREVVIPYRYYHPNPPRPGKKTVERRNVHAIVKNPKTGKILALKWTKHPWVTFPMGGIDGDEDTVTAARREVREETGYTDLKFERVLGGQVKAEYFAAHKDENRISYTRAVFFTLKSEKREPVSEKELAEHEVVWLDLSKITSEHMVHAELDVWLDRMTGDEQAYTNEGVLINSGQFDGLSSGEGRKKIVEWLVSGGRAKPMVQYHLRDWLISRQRYWGSPIPMIYCETCADAGKGERKDMPGWYSVSEKDLPVALPYVKDFRPKGTGVSPLASVKEFYEVKCPACGKTARRETDVSDTFLDSAWYYLRYLDPKNMKEPWNKSRVKHWLPIGMYIGGAEHAVLHLLYFRFVAKVFHDWGFVDFDEPTKRFRSHGLLIRGGKKISKSKRNIVNPDEFIEKYGADALRLHLMFLGPFEEGGDFRDEGIMGPVRFLERVWRYFEGWKKSSSREKPRLSTLFHQRIKNITKDIEQLKYNTCVSRLMMLLSGIEMQRDLKIRGGIGEPNKEPEYINDEYVGIFLKLLAPFAPYITEELWSELGHKTSIHKESWPTYEEKLIEEKSFFLIIQVNGRVRDGISLPIGASESQASEFALSREKVKNLIGGKKIKKVIFVPNRLINFVVP